MLNICCFLDVLSKEGIVLNWFFKDEGVQSKRASVTFRGVVVNGLFWASSTCKIFFSFILFFLMFSE